MRDWKASGDGKDLVIDARCFELEKMLVSICMGMEQHLALDRGYHRC